MAEETLKTDFRDVLKRLEKGQPLCEPFKLGSVTLSIQASPSHYCMPREMLENFRDYTSFEVALWDTVTQDWLYPCKCRVLHGTQLAQKYSSAADVVSGYVPVGVVQEFYERLVKLQQEGVKVEEES